MFSRNILTGKTTERLSQQSNGRPFLSLHRFLIKGGNTLIGPNPRVLESQSWKDSWGTSGSTYVGRDPEGKVLAESYTQPVKSGWGWRPGLSE